MAFGPEQTLPIGTKKRKILAEIEKKIDDIIGSTEGNAVTIHSSVWNYSLEYIEDIISLYKRAGWKHVYYDGSKTKISDPRLILNNE